MRPPVSAFALTEAALACATPEGAYANCLALSVRYAQWLRDRGEPAGLLRLAGSRTAFPAAAGRWPLCDPRGFAHWVTVSGDAAVDWTWRQFESGAAWPLVVPVEALAAGWEDASIWACEDCAELVADRRHQELAPSGMHAEHRAIARTTGGAGPFPDPRHDRTAPLEPLCSCAAAQPV